MITLTDAVIIDIQEFLDACEGGDTSRCCLDIITMVQYVTSLFPSPTEHGRNVPTIDQPPLFLEEPFDLGKHTVAYEARYVKALFSKVA